MKKTFLIILSMLLIIAGLAYARTTTTDLELVLPTWDENIDLLLTDLIGNWNILEDFANDPLEFDTGERVEDRTGAMWTGNTETFVAVTYQDADNTIDAVVPVLDEDNMVSNSAAYLATQQSIKAYVDNTLAAGFQPLDAGLTSISGLTTAAGTIIYTSALDTYVVVSANATATHMFLRQYSSGAPTWIQLDSDDLSDVASIAMLNEAETITGNWVNTTNPWADNEVSDTLTVTGYMQDEDINTFSELQSWVTDKTLVNEEDVFTIDANWVNTANPWADNEVANNITIDLATLASTLTVADNESTNEDNALVFLPGGDLDGGNLALECDGNLYYNPSTGALTANMHRVYLTDESTALNAAWYQITSSVVTGDLTGLRTVMSTDAVSGGDAVTGVNIRGVYGQAVVEASGHAGLVQGGLFVADLSDGSCVAYNVHVLCAHYSTGASATIGGDLYVGYLRRQSREDNVETVGGSDSILAIENEAVQGDGGTVVCGIRIFETNISGAVTGFTYGIDMDDAGITTDIRLSDSHTIIDSATGIAISLLNPTTISGLSNVTSADADYIMIWDATDSTLKKCDMGEVRGAGAGYTDLTEFVDQTAWRVFYSNTDGDVTELALGASGTYLKSNGAASAPTFATPAGAGDVVKVGTPADSQVGVWTGDGTIEGDASFTYDQSNMQFTGDIGSTGTRITKGWFTDLQVTNAIAGSITGTAAIATGVTCTDNENEDLDCAVLFADGYTSTQGVETDGDFHYSPDTGLLTATSFAGNPLHDVTTSSANNTLTVAEAGLILVSDAHTETLPTASGNTGLTYHFIKTDADYDLITLEGDGSETFNYENSTGTPNLTYLRLNTYCAEVTIVSDGTNWQVINEKLGQAPECHVYSGSHVDNLPEQVWAFATLDTETTDIGSNFDLSTWESGNATSSTSYHLIDTNASFTSEMVGVRVKNTTDTTETWITACNSGTDVTVRDDIFVNTEAYEIKNAKFVAPVSGRYLIVYNVAWRSTTVVADKRYSGIIRINDTDYNMYHIVHPSHVETVTNNATSVVPLSASDYLVLKAYNNSGAETVGIQGIEDFYYYLKVRLISKD